MVKRRSVGNVKQITFAPHGHLLTNSHVWSPDSKWIVYDVRSDPSGSLFDGTRIERVHIDSLEVQVLYSSKNLAGCGVATYSPTEELVAFIHGPENPTKDWEYGFYHRHGALVETSKPGVARTLDAINIVHPYTPGALRGGSHVHVFDPTGQRISFTYEDHVLATRPIDRVAVEQVADDRSNDREVDLNQRNIGVTKLNHPVAVPKTHPRNQDGLGFTVLATQTCIRPKPGSDEIQRAYEEAWIGTENSLAFLGDCIGGDGKMITELFRVDLPIDPTKAGSYPLEGTETRRPWPPYSTNQRRLTRTQDRKFPGIQAPRHWPRSHPNGSSIAVLMKDDRGIVQLFLVDPDDGSYRQLTHLEFPVASTFTWSPDGERIAFIADGSVMVADSTTGECHRLTTKRIPEPRSEASVFSPDGRKIAYLCQCATSSGETWNQIFIVELND